jgi:hypothetical protein
LRGAAEQKNFIFYSEARAQTQKSRQPEEADGFSYLLRSAFLRVI